MPAPSSPAHPTYRPFQEAPWRGDRRTAAQAIWNWHATLWALATGPDGSAVDYGAIGAAVRRGTFSPGMPEQVQRAALAACAGREGGPALLAVQAEAAAQLAAPVRFATRTEADAFVQAWAVSHARLLAGLADADHSWQQPYLEELARAFFWTGRLMHLADDARSDRLFFPQSELAEAGVHPDALREGNVTPEVQTWMWREVVRARDAYAQGMPLVHDLSRKAASAFRRWWMGGVETLNLVEGRRYDVWSEPVTLGWRRLQVEMQARFSRTTFRRR